MIKKIEVLAYTDYKISENHIWITLKIHAENFKSETELSNTITNLQQENQSLKQIMNRGDTELLKDYNNLKQLEKAVRELPLQAIINMLSKKYDTTKLEKLLELVGTQK